MEFLNGSDFYLELRVSGLEPSTGSMSRASSSSALELSACWKRASSFSEHKPAWAFSLKARSSLGLSSNHWAQGVMGTVRRRDMGSDKEIYGPPNTFSPWNAHFNYLSHHSSCFPNHNIGHTCHLAEGNLVFLIIDHRLELMGPLFSFCHHVHILI
jgi:hypothetical protein